MKLYSRGQVAGFTLAAMLLLTLFAFGFGIIQLPSRPEDNGQKRTGGEKDQEQTLTEKVDGKDPREKSFALKTNPPLSSRDMYPAQTTETYTEDEIENIRVYESLNKGVVNISTEVVAYNWFLEPVPREGGSGSGSIIDERGYVLTNKHVVEKAYKVFITLADGTQYEGEVIGVDPENDLAVVFFDPQGKELTTIPFGSSSDLKVGQKVLAIGNPFGYERTLTTGIVSGLGRPVKTSDDFIIRDMVQTDASINPGNSGGPLLDSRGRMIGINTMIYSPSGGSVGIGFAVSVDTARRIVPDLITHGVVRRGWIEIVPVQLFPELVKYAELPVSRGLLVSRVIEGGNADKAGLKGGTKPVRYGRSTIYLGGDIIIEIDGERVASLADMFGALEDNRPGDEVTVVAYRGKKKKQFTLVLSERENSAGLE